MERVSVPVREKNEKIEKESPIVLGKSCGITILSMPLGPNEVRTASLTASGVQGEREKCKSVRSRSMISRPQARLLEQIGSIHHGVSLAPRFECLLSMVLQSSMPSRNELCLILRDLLRS